MRATGRQQSVRASHWQHQSLCVVAGATGAKKSVERGDTSRCRSCCRDTKKATWHGLTGSVHALHIHAVLTRCIHTLLTRYKYILCPRALAPHPGCSGACNACNAAMSVVSGFLRSRYSSVSLVYKSRVLVSFTN
jgi:hypothetical protein